MSRISECIDEFEQSKLNAGQMFFIFLSFIPMMFLFPMWIVAKFIYEPWVEKLSEMREDLPEIPFLDRMNLIANSVMVNPLLLAIGRNCSTFFNDVK